jgi:hypothetical protein
VSEQDFSKYGYPSDALNTSAGLGAGLTEAVFAVTPSETIKSVTRRVTLKV